RAARLTLRDVAALELTDPHGIAAALALEANGFAERGAGVQLAVRAPITPRARLPATAAGTRRAVMSLALTACIR
ncbi:MAG: hypothetical protein HC828_08445, partial [Blastochloris sp.]|nr:hypothetical protein [Blastochloris sp.]